MGTEWVVSAGVEKVTLTAGKADLTFTVTNPGPVQDRVVFDVVPSDGADREWFAVEEPQRTVPAGGSVPYLVKLALPPKAPAQSYWVQGRAYSADTAPEESSKLSGRVAFDVAAPVPKKRPWWLWAIPAAVLVVVVAGVLFFLLRDTDAVVPPLAGKTEAEAKAALEEVGLEVGTVRHRHAPAEAGKVQEQNAAPGGKLAKGAAVSLVVAIDLKPPQLVAPANGKQFPDAKMPTLTWKALPNANGYVVEAAKEHCSLRFQKVGGPLTSICNFVAPKVAVTDELTHVPEIVLLGGINPLSRDSGLVRWRVTARDDFGNPGQSAEYRTFRCSVQP